MPTRGKSATASGATSCADYLVVADALNASGTDVVSIQHEYGIWGGADGGYVLDFVRALVRPVGHDAPHRPAAADPAQREILTSLIAMSDLDRRDVAGRGLPPRSREYGVDRRKLEIVPHGVPNLPLVDPDGVKPRLGPRRVVG